MRAPLLDYVRDMEDIQDELGNFKFKQYPCMFEVHLPNKDIGEKLFDVFRGEAKFIHLVENSYFLKAYRQDNVIQVYQGDLQNDPVEKIRDFVRNNNRPIFGDFYL